MSGARTSRSRVRQLQTNIDTLSACNAANIQELHRADELLGEARAIARRCFLLAARVVRSEHNVWLAPWSPDEHERMRAIIASWEKEEEEPKPAAEPEPHRYDVKMLRALMRDGVITKEDLEAALKEA